MKFQNRRGFTLVELLIYMGLMAIFLVVLTDIFVSVLNLQSESAATSSVEQDGRYILSRLLYDIPRASAITVPSSLGQTSANTSTLTINGANVTYDATSGNLLLGTDQLNSFGSTVSGLTFQRLGKVGGKNDLQIKFTLSSLTSQGKGREVRNFQITVGQR